MLPAEALAGIVPLPFGLLPAPAALQIVPLEYGFHRNDLEWALGDQAPLSADISTALLELAPGLMPMLAAGSPVSGAGEQPGTPLAYQLAAAGATISAVFDGAAWAIMPGAPAGPKACQISGDDSPVALFIMGRISAAHPGLTVSDPAAAGHFKRYFPGP
jgi:hypothetical protein